jgi:hypothetical protein
MGDKVNNPLALNLIRSDGRVLKLKKITYGFDMGPA